MKNMIAKIFFLSLLSFFLLLNCSTNTTQSKAKNEGDDVILPDYNFANVISIQVSGTEMAYIFSVKIKSPDTGCKQYADWWEVVSEDGELIYRRILAHSHVNEQPFVRSGGNVNITGDQTVIIRGHMNNNGYGRKAFKGSVNKGFTEVMLDTNFAIDLEQKEPLPENCAF